MFIAIHPATYRGGGFLAHGVLNFFFFYRNSEYFCNQDSFVVFIPFVNSDDFHSKYSILTVEFLYIIFEVKVFAGSNEHAKIISDNWKNNAQVIYPQILDLLTEN